MKGQWVYLLSTFFCPTLGSCLRPTKIFDRAPLGMRVSISRDSALLSHRL